MLHSFLTQYIVFITREPVLDPILSSISICSGQKSSDGCALSINDQDQ